MKPNNPNKMNSIDDQKKTLIISIKDRNMNNLDQFQMTLTEHSSERIKERDICGDSLQLALIYGRAFFKQGLVFYVLGEQNLPNNIDSKLRKKCMNLVVVTAGDSDQIITSYRNHNPFKYIKKKSKRLSKHKYAA